MCGFFFIYDSSRSVEKLTEAADQALGALQHRGPDARGLYLDAPVALGHHRLSIIDLGGSHQPMHHPGKTHDLVYNGEIYNYRELREQLKDRWRFRTEGDTEVLLAGLTTEGPDFCKKMEGMWAFALWNRRDQSLLMGRDRMGKKPLYFQRTPDGFVCASELAALSTIAPQWEEDYDSTADYFRYGYYMPGTTAYRNVYEVMPGHVAAWNVQGEVQQQPYWSLNIKPFTGSKADAIDQLKHTFIQALERRLVADVEVGAFLSGGVDSSLVVSLMTHVLGKRPKTFTIGFSSGSYDERHFARTVADYCRTDHHEDVLDTLESNALETLVLKHMGQPFADPSLLPTALVSRLAARHVKVVLSGDGGDEVFCGYQRYQAQVLLRWYSRLPGLVRDNIERVIRSLPEPVAHHSSSLIKKAHMFVDIARIRGHESHYTAPLFYSREDLVRIAPDLERMGHPPPGLPERTRLDDIHAMMAMDTLIYLPQDILAKVDRATMASSLEARSPFLDTDVVELAFNMPRRWHRRGLSGKRMLRETFRDSLPSNIWRRRKQGFSIPMSQWFRGALGDALRQLLGKQTSLLNSGQLMTMLDIHKAGKKDYGPQLWGAYVYLLWKEKSVLSRPPEGAEQALGSFSPLGEKVRMRENK